MNHTEWQAKQQARRVAAAALHASFPYLVPVNEKTRSLNAAAKNIRIELKRAFPGVKFSVRSSSYSGGDSIRVSWIDGPTTAQVDPIVNRYSAGTFDGMTDCYNYEANAWTDAFGDAKFVFTERENSDRAIASAIRYVATKYAGNFTAYNIAVPTVEQFRSGKLWSVVLIPGANCGVGDLQTLIYAAMARRTWAIAKEAPAAVQLEAEVA